MLLQQLQHSSPGCVNASGDISISLSIVQKHFQQPCKLCFDSNWKAFAHWLYVGWLDMVSSTMVKQGMLGHLELLMVPNELKLNSG